MAFVPLLMLRALMGRFSRRRFSCGFHLLAVFISVCSSAARGQDQRHWMLFSLGLRRAGFFFSWGSFKVIPVVHLYNGLNNI
jgi:hypothetical protein